MKKHIRKSLFTLVVFLASSSYYCLAQSKLDIVKRSLNDVFIQLDPDTKFSRKLQKNTKQGWGVWEYKYVYKGFTVKNVNVVGESITVEGVYFIEEIATVTNPPDLDNVRTKQIFYNNYQYTYKSELVPVLDDFEPSWIIIYLDDEKKNSLKLY